MVQVGTTKDRGLYNKPSVAVHPGALVAGTCHNTIRYASSFIKDWHVTEEVSCSEHRYIRFALTGIDRLVQVNRNPHRTD